MLNVGDYYKHSFLFTQEDVIGFAKVTGDNNPVHLDTVYASGTIFKKPIILFLIMHDKELGFCRDYIDFFRKHQIFSIPAIVSRNISD